MSMIGIANISIVELLIVDDSFSVQNCLAGVGIYVDSPDTPDNIKSCFGSLKKQTLLTVVTSALFPLLPKNLFIAKTQQLLVETKSK